MGEEVKCNSNSGSRGSNRRQGQLEALRITMKAIRAITSSFRDCLRGDNSRMDSLVDNVNFILDKQSGLNTGLEEGNDASEPMEISGSSPSVGAELESLKAGLLSIQLQVNAYRGLADDHGSLNLLLQNLGALIGKHSHMFSPSVRINNNIRHPIRPIPSASAKVEIIDLELEPDLPDSTFETFGIQTGSDAAAAAGADVIIDHNLNPVSSSTGDHKHVEDVKLPHCSSFVAPSIPQNRKRKTNSKMTVDSRANMTSKTAKVVTKPGTSSSPTRPSLRNSREENHTNSEMDVTVKNPNFIQNNNANLSGVKIEADYDPPGRNQILIKQEDAHDAAADNDVEMSDKPLIEKDQQSSERSPDPDVNNGLGETVQVQNLALNLTAEATLIQQNGSNIFEQNKIWTVIFKNLDLKDQKNVRFVSKQWKQMADARLTHEKCWKLIIDNKFRKRYRGKTLDDLSDCIANSDGGFPLTTLIFGYLDSQCNDYTKPSLLRLYNLHGSKITSLVLRDFRASAAALHDLLLNRLPNIENIYIYRIWLTKNEKLFTSSNGQELITLPKLKTIRFGLDIDPRNKAHQAIFNAFLASAVNLKEVENVHSHMLPCIAQAGKLNCVKNFKFFPRIFIKAYTKNSWPNKKMSAFEQPTDLASFEKLCELQPKLTTLKINVQTFKSRELVPQYITGLNKILQSSKDTLKRLQIPSFFFVPGLVIPNLKNLYLLEVYHCFSVKNLDPPALFPGNLNLSEVFPNVRVLSCFLVGIANETDWISKYFPLGNNNNNNEGESSNSSAFEMSRSFPSVTRLEFENHYCFGKALELYFPMLTNIICHEFDLTYRNGVHVGANCGLRETTIGIESLELRGFRFNGENSRLDELFTGIPRSECLRLNDGDCHSTAQAGNHLFQNLKDLRRLEIAFDHLDNTKLKPSSSGSDSLFDEPIAIAVITPVSYRFAFALMENLKQVFFAYNNHLPAASDFAKIILPCCTEFRPPAAH